MLVRRTPQPWTVIVGLLVAALLFVALGDWQLHRLAWKEALIARVAQATMAPPQVFAADAALEYHRVVVSGRYEPASTTLVTATTELGSGYWDMVALACDAEHVPAKAGRGGRCGRNHLAAPVSPHAPSVSLREPPPPKGEDLRSGRDVVGNGARFVWVNRGFVATGSRRAVVAESTPTGAVTVTGLIRLTEPYGTWLRANRPGADRWYSRDLAAMAQARHLAGAAPGLFIDVQEEVPRAAGGAPVPGLTMLTFPNNHLGYAMTWFALALMSAGGAIVLWRRPS